LERDRHPRTKSTFSNEIDGDAVDLVRGSRSRRVPFAGRRRDDLMARQLVARRVPFAERWR